MIRTIFSGCITAAIFVFVTALPLAAQPSLAAAVQSFPLWAQAALLVVPAVGAISAAIGLTLNFYQARRTNAQARAAMVADCLKSFAEDEDIQRAFYAIEYEKFQYDDEFHESEIERPVDKLLRHFSNIALSWQAGLLNIDDIQPIQYYVLRVTRNQEVREYLEFMAKWAEEQELGEHPYAVLSQLSERLNR